MQKKIKISLAILFVIALSIGGWMYLKKNISNGSSY